MSTVAAQGNRVLAVANALSRLVTYQPARIAGVVRKADPLLTDAEVNEVVTEYVSELTEMRREERNAYQRVRNSRRRNRR